jgi:hypothetical protein
MVRLVVALVVLVIVLIIRLIMWLARPKVVVPTYSIGAGPGGGWGQGSQPGYGPQGGYGPQPGYGPPAGVGPFAGYGYGAPQLPVHGMPAPGPVRVLARQDCGFDQLSACLAQAGLQLAAAPGPAVQPGEPSGALWQSATAQVRYTFDPTTYSRILEIIGPQAEQLRHHLQSRVG